MIVSQMAFFAVKWHRIDERSDHIVFFNLVTKMDPLAEQVFKVLNQLMIKKELK